MEDASLSSDIYKIKDGNVYLWITEGRATYEQIGNLTWDDAVVALGVTFTPEQAEALAGGNYIVIVNSPWGREP